MTSPPPRISPPPRQRRFGLRRCCGCRSAGDRSRRQSRGLGARSARRVYERRQAAVGDRDHGNTLSRNTLSPRRTALSSDSRASDRRALAAIGQVVRSFVAPNGSALSARSPEPISDSITIRARAPDSAQLAASSGRGNPELPWRVVSRLTRSETPELSLHRGRRRTVLIFEVAARWIRRPGE